jgi:hypothetical protein
MLDDLEDAMRKLGVEYNVYFNGGRSRPPADIAWRVDNYFRMLNDNTNLNFSQRFRLTQLLQRHGSMQSVWRRKAEIKEGGYRRPADRLLSVVGVGPSAERETPASTASVVLTGDRREETQNIEKLYRAFLQARELSNEGLPPGSLDHFRTFILKKAEQIRREQAADILEASVTVEEGRVKLTLKGKK